MNQNNKMVGKEFKVKRRNKIKWRNVCTNVCQWCNVTHFDSSGVEYIPKEIKNLMDNNNITINIYRIEANDSVMREKFCIGFINSMVKGKSLLGYGIFFLLTNMKRTIK